MFLFGKPSETVPVKAVEARAGGNPDEPPAVLKDMAHLPVRKAFIDAEVLYLCVKVLGWQVQCGQQAEEDEWGGYGWCFQFAWMFEIQESVRVLSNIAFY